MASITIHDEATRDVVLRALWSRMSDPVGGDSILNVLFDLAWNAGTSTEPGGVADARAEIDVLLGELNELRALIRRVQSADLGTTVEVTLDSGKFTDGVSAISEAVRDDRDRFFDAPAADRARMLELYDAAKRLLAELPVGAVA